MRRLWPVLIAILAVVAVAGWWLARPAPTTSVFKNWIPSRIGRTWTITGVPGSSSLSLVDCSGAIQPTRDSYTIYFLLYDCDHDALYSPLLGNVRVRRSLVGGSLPSPRIVWDAGDLGLIQTVFATREACYAGVTVESGSHRPRSLSVFAAVVPYGVAGAMHRPASARYDGDSRSILVDGKTFLSCEIRPTAGAAISTEPGSDITGSIRRGRLAGGNVAEGDLRRIASAAMQFDLTLRPHGSEQLQFASVLGGTGSRESYERAQARFGEAWRSRLGRADLRIPDKRIADCYKASVAYLILLSGSGNPMPGPTKYRSFWIRDCAYMSDALCDAGQGDLIEPAYRQIVAMQSPNGGFPPKLGTKNEDELDAPGEAIYTLVQRYRRTGDRNWLASVWPVIRSAAGYIRASRIPGGMMPASLSAEDIGPGTQQHYWDDFWCIRGLRDAAFAARELGQAKDAAWIDSEARSLANATRASIEAAMKKHSISYIPNGPDDTIVAAAARGTSCALWPCAALDPNDPLVKRSFDVYWDACIAPSGGGFVHRGHYWPYAGLDLAQDYVILGERDRAMKILRWTVDHDPSRGFYAYPEGISQRGFGLAEGDMPHGWFCASYVSLVRKVFGQHSGR